MKKLVLIILSCIILSACEVEHLTYEEAQKRRFIGQNGTPLEEMLGVGEEMQVKKVAKGDKYSVLYEAKNGDLEWLELSDLYFKDRKPLALAMGIGLFLFF